jgi:hypothetical protein
MKYKDNTLDIDIVFWYLQHKRLYIVLMNIYFLDFLFVVYNFVCKFFCYDYKKSLYFV